MIGNFDRLEHFVAPGYLGLEHYKICAYISVSVLTSTVEPIQ